MKHLKTYEAYSNKPTKNKTIYKDDWRTSRIKEFIEEIDEDLSKILKSIPHSGLNVYFEYPQKRHNVNHYKKEFYLHISFKYDDWDHRDFVKDAIDAISDYYLGEDKLIITDMHFYKSIESGYHIAIQFDRSNGLELKEKPLEIIRDQSNLIGSYFEGKKMGLL